MLVLLLALLMVLSVAVPATAKKALGDDIPWAGLEIPDGTVVVPATAPGTFRLN
jgi:hypothetical protein